MVSLVALVVKRGRKRPVASVGDMVIHYGNTPVICITGASTGDSLWGTVISPIVCIVSVILILEHIRALEIFI